MKGVLLVLGAVGAAVLALAGFTWWALESGGVAIAETQRAGAEPRSTHVWFANHEGDIWLEAGTPENGWYRDILASPRLRLSIDGRAADYLAAPVHDPAAQARLRALLRKKYGLRDRWVGLFIDSEGTVPVRLIPAADAAG